MEKRARVPLCQETTPAARLLKGSPGLTLSFTLCYRCWRDLDASSILIKLHLPSAGHVGQKSSCAPKAQDTQEGGWTCRDLQR